MVSSNPKTVSKTASKSAEKSPTKPAIKSAAPTQAKPIAAKVPVKPPIKKSTPSPAKSIQAAAKAIAKVTKPAVVKSDKPVKPKKPKMVRDSFTIPKAEYLVLEELKLRAIKLARPIKKGELLRAGIKALAAMQDNAFLSALNAVPILKTGRPNSTTSKQN
jgi:hypothetical protein